VARPVAARSDEVIERSIGQRLNAYRAVSDANWISRIHPPRQLAMHYLHVVLNAQASALPKLAGERESRHRSGHVTHPWGAATRALDLLIRAGPMTEVEITMALGADVRILLCRASSPGCSDADWLRRVGGR
jgi:hypothetical protein